MRIWKDNIELDPRKEGKQPRKIILLQKL